MSWRVGLNWTPRPDSLLYANVSKGYKSGSFPTIPFTSATEIHPVTQESLLAYEVGFKSSLFDRQLVVDGAAFYYDYRDKQILGNILDPFFGPLLALVNIPKSDVRGFELSAHWAPSFLRGLTVSPAVSYQDTRIKTYFEKHLQPGGAQCVWHWRPASRELL